MKNLMKMIMSIDSEGQYGTDYSHICFLYFMMEHDLYSTRVARTKDFNAYLYRFYIDNLVLCQKHWSRHIQNIFLYKPEDLFDYCKECLKSFKGKTQSIIDFDDENIVFIYPKEFFSEKDKTLIQKIVIKIAEKYCGIAEFEYREEIIKEDFHHVTEQKLGDKLFNRLIENLNYCFVCESEEISDLVITRLSNNTDAQYDIDNYLLLCSRDHNDYINKKLIFRKNGYPYLNGKRLYTHLNITELKKVRQYLVD